MKIGENIINYISQIFNQFWILTTWSLLQDVQLQNCGKNTKNGDISFQITFFVW